MQAENRGQSRSASLASLVGDGEPAVLLPSKLSGAQVFKNDWDSVVKKDKIRAVERVVFSFFLFSWTLLMSDVMAAWRDLRVDCLRFVGRS